MASVAKPVVVFMLMLATAMVAHGAVLCKNELPVPITINSCAIAAGDEGEVALLDNTIQNLIVVLEDLTGTVFTTPIYCPLEVTKLSCVKVDVGVEIVVKEVNSALSGLLNTVAGLLNQILGISLETIHVKLA